MDIPTTPRQRKHITFAHPEEDEHISLSPDSSSLSNSFEEELEGLSFGLPTSTLSGEDESEIHVDIGDDGVIDPRTSKVTLADWELLTVIGKGGYGKVYQVRHNETQNIYAMKVLRKDFLLKTDNVEYTKTEKDVLRKVRHPFIVSLHYSFQTESKVYLAMDFINGGQLLYHLRSEAMFSEEIARFHAAEVVLAIDYLHSLDIIHRDLKPENILLDAHGHISLTDFGFAKELATSAGKTSTFCGTVAYMSPEIIKGESYGKEVDWWSLGILVFDMLTGSPPFLHKNEATLHKKILTEKIRLPTYLSPSTHSFIKGLLERDPLKRLGSGVNGAKNVKSHPFFKGTNWKKMLNREITPPFLPSVPRGPLDVSNFDGEYLNQEVLDTPTDCQLSTSQAALFTGFSYARTPDGFARTPESGPPSPLISRSPLDSTDIKVRVA